ncbi:MAG TPA: hypothetical protein VMU29_10750 [Smithella sp.]|nr:hypothetical protein [Smithella sp.]
MTLKVPKKINDAYGRHCSNFISRQIAGSLKRLQATGYFNAVWMIKILLIIHGNSYTKKNIVCETVLKENFLKNILLTEQDH